MTKSLKQTYNDLQKTFFSNHSQSHNTWLACSGFQPAWNKIHGVPTLLHLFIIYSQGWVWLLLQGVGFKANTFPKAPCLCPPFPQFGRHGPTEMMIRWIYGAISESHLLLQARESKAKFPDGSETEIIQFVPSDCKLPQAVLTLLL